MAFEIVLLTRAVTLAGNLRFSTSINPMNTDQHYEAKEKLNRRNFLGHSSALAVGFAGSLAVPSLLAAKKPDSGLPPIALSYVNPYLEYSPDGTVDASAFFEAGLEEQWQISPAHMLAGGVRLVILSPGFNDPDVFPGAAGVDLMIRCLDAVSVAAEKRPDCVLVRTAADLRGLEKSGKLGVVLHLTGLPIHGSLQILRSYARMGARSIHPFIRSSPFGGDAADMSVELTPLGRKVIREMERSDMLVDIAHANDRTCDAVLKMATRPLLDSHTACRALRDLPRNRTDDQLRAISANGGVVGVHFGSKFLEDLSPHPHFAAWQKYRDSIPDTRDQLIAELAADNPFAYLEKRYNVDSARRKQLAKRPPPPRAKLTSLLDHIEHMVEVAGIDHVCIGSDYFLSNLCEGTESVTKMPALAQALRGRGVSEDEVAKIMGGNLMRLLGQSLPR